MSKEIINIKEPIDIYAALARFQSMLKPIPFDSYNPHYKSKFASLSAIVEKITPILAETGLSYVQRLTSENSTYRLETVLYYKDQSLTSGTMELKLAKNDMQGIGAACTYARRFQLSALLGLVSDEDTDAEPPTQTAAKIQKHIDESKTQNQIEQKSQEIKAVTNNVARALVELQMIVRNKKIPSDFMSEAIRVLFNKTQSKELNKEQVEELTRLLSGDIEDFKSYLSVIRQEQEANSRNSK